MSVDLGPTVYVGDTRVAYRKMCDLSIEQQRETDREAGYSIIDITGKGFKTGMRVKSYTEGFLKGLGFRDAVQLFIGTIALQRHEDSAIAYIAVPRDLRPIKVVWLPKEKLTPPHLALPPQAVSAQMKG